MLLASIKVVRAYYEGRVHNILLVASVINKNGYTCK